jgi:hypothetical protein
VVLDIDPQSQGTDYWEQNRHEDLTAQEQAIYHMVDTMKTIRGSAPMWTSSPPCSRATTPRAKVDLGPYFTVYSFNPVEGNRFRVGGRTSTNFSAVPNYNGYAAYGTKRRPVQVRLGGQDLREQGAAGRSCRPRTRTTWNSSAKASMRSARTTSSAAPSGARPTTSSPWLRNGPASYEREWFTGLGNTVMLRYRTLFPLGDLEYLRTVDDGPVTDASIPSARPKYR